MAAVALVTDSTADIPKDVRERLNIAMVPLKVIVGEQSYLDNIELQPVEFYEMITKTGQLAKSSQPSPADFFEVFSSLIDQGYAVVCVNLSSAMSGTYQSACIAKSMFEDDVDITVIDSRSASFGYGQFVVKAAEMALAGATSEQIVAEISRLRDQLKLYFLVETLEYLQKGGRIGKASAVLGTLLNIKPILSIDDEGSIFPIDKVRGHKKAMNRIVEMLQADFSDRPVNLAIAKTPGFENGVAEMAELAKSNLNVQIYSEVEIGPVIGAHAGPGTIGLFVTPV
ncbi:MAG: DegV family protein [Candidatus Cohnella colombiensis]|uniref:DegV family protein n=1 Tax=Candidatus Cohnella colombiensis TaxID=3121368 RepID=A0AA95ETY3_9BACL|nr:MAG: DegV family protein [Cohnella sp.]